MKFSNAALLFTSLFSVFGATQAADKPFVFPDKIPLKVRIRHGKICDADKWGQGDAGDSDGYVKVAAKLWNKDGGTKWVNCGKTRVISNNNNPVWEETLNCGELSKDDWDELKLYFSMVDRDLTEDDDDGLGRGWYPKFFKYGERSTPRYNSVTSAYGSECGTSTVWFTIFVPKVETSFCLQPDPNGPFRKETIDDGYWQTHEAITAFEEKGYEIGYAGEIKTISGEQVKLDATCNHKEYVEVTLCTRKKDEYGDCGREVMDQDLLRDSKKFYQDLGYQTFHPGDKIKYLDGMGVVQKDCTVDPDGATSFGDPHFKRWNGEQYDFHGGCDLVLLQNPKFRHGLGLNVHIRTQIHSWWSSIVSAAIRIGDNTLQITGGTDSIKYWVNGEENELVTGDAYLGDFQVNFRRVNEHQSQTRVDLGNRADAVAIETYKHFVRVNLKDKKYVSFVGSSGLLGIYPSGEMIGRDGRTKFTDANEFGQEWMVGPGDEILFNDVDAHDLPLVCAMPHETAKEEARRRLGAAAITEEEATLACARVRQADKDACIFDVMATQDKDIAGSY